MTENEKIIEVFFHGRGGQTAVTASELLSKIAFEKGFADTIAIPIIGAERRGAPIMAFTKISKNKRIKTYDSVKEPDYMVIFDSSLLEMERIKATIKEGVILIVNSKKPLDKSQFPSNVRIFTVDATGICIKKGFMHSSGAILNIPMLGAFGKVTGYYDIDVMESVIRREFGDKKIQKNLEVARDAYESVKEV